MNLANIKPISILALFAIMMLALITPVPPAMAQEAVEHEGTIDMETDNDGNGILDEFETQFRKMLASMNSIEVHPEDLENVYESESHKAFRGFYERLPIKAQTKRPLDACAFAFQKLAKADSLQKQQKELDALKKGNRELLDSDPVYAQAVGYIGEIAGSPPQADNNPGSERDSGSGLLLSENQMPSVLEDQINRIGDVIFLDTRGPTDTQSDSFVPAYVMDWTHVGLYNGSGEVYDAHPSPCSNGGNGVALRLIDRYYRSGNRVMYGQLADVSGRGSEAAGLANAKEEYGTLCETPFQIIVFDVSGTDSFYCSKLVWRVYNDNETYPVNLNSNADEYYNFIAEKYGPDFAWMLVLSTVAPGEIALDDGLDTYSERTVI